MLTINVNTLITLIVLNIFQFYATNSFSQTGRGELSEHKGGNLSKRLRESG